MGDFALFAASVRDCLVSFATGIATGLLAYRLWSAARRRRPQSTATDDRLTADEWYRKVVAECKRRGYAEWFYCDRDAWLYHWREGDSPEGAIYVNLESMQ